MTAKDIKHINKEISRLRAKVVRLESEAVNTTAKMSDTPAVGCATDKIGNAVTEITDIQREIQNLEILRNSALNRLSRDIFEENCLFMRLSLHYSWTKIAVQVGGNNTADGIRKICDRYSW